MVVIVTGYRQYENMYNKNRHRDIGVDINKYSLRHEMRVLVYYALFKYMNHIIMNYLYLVRWSTLTSLIIDSP